MNPPIEPNKEDCCNSGCVPCIFDVYEKQKKLYRAYLEHGEISKGTKYENGMSKLEYNQFHVVKNIDMCYQHRLILFKHSACDKVVYWSPGEHFLLKYSVVGQCCTRAYTPIKIDMNLEEDYDFAVIIKRYENGLVSQFVCDLNIGDQTLWRGPYGHYQIDLDKYQRMVMIAQGTGIAPMFSIIKHILNDENTISRIFLFYCCKNINSILLRDELCVLKSYWNFEYYVYLSDVPDKTAIKYKEPIVSHRLTNEDIVHLAPFVEEDQFLLCGSDGFMNCYHEWLQGENVSDDRIVLF